MSKIKDTLEKETAKKIAEAELLMDEPKKGYRFIDEKKQHLHTLDGKPLMGTTTVVGEVLQPPLAWYGSGKAVELLGVRNPKELTLLKNGKLPQEAKELLLAGLVDAHRAIKDLDTDSYLELVMKAYRNHSEYKDTRAEEGDTLHDTLEKYVKEMITANKGNPYKPTVPFEDDRINKFIDWAVENVEKFLFAECYCYSEVMWMGGKFDLIFTGKDGKTYIGDYKSAKESYHKNWVQMALYDKQIIENGVLDKEGNRVDTWTEKEGEENKLKGGVIINGYALFPFGGKIVPDYRFNCMDYWKAADGVLANYKLINQK